MCVSMYVVCVCVWYVFVTINHCKVDVFFVFIIYNILLLLFFFFTIGWNPYSPTTYETIWLRYSAYEPTTRTPRDPDQPLILRGAAARRQCSANHLKSVKYRKCEHKSKEMVSQVSREVSCAEVEKTKPETMFA